MTRVLVVDDEKIVRKGIIGVMPWEAHEMVVVGEARHGEEALGFLESNIVDLLITDLTMPGLSGTDFLARVRAQYPEVMIVVLTFHQEFETIQEVLRLGVIDYITKAQIERDNVDSTLRRVKQRITEERVMRTLGVSTGLGNDCSRLIAIASRDGLQGCAGISALPDVAETILLDDDLMLVVCRETCDEEMLRGIARETAAHGSGLVMRITGDCGMTFGQLRAAIREQVDLALFYRADANAEPPELVLAPGNGSSERLTGKLGKELERRFTSAEFVHGGDVVPQLLADLESIGASEIELEHFFMPVYCNWCQVVDADPGRYYEHVRELSTWTAWKAWIIEMTATINTRLGADRYSARTILGIRNAVSYINKHFVEELDLAEVLEISALSKSHFSECFKELTGKTFGQYVRDLRVDHATKLLRQTAIPVYRVAWQSGFPDEKYFARAFRRNTGMSPGEYRTRRRSLSPPS